MCCNTPKYVMEEGGGESEMMVWHITRIASVHLIQGN